MREHRKEPQAEPVLQQPEEAIKDLELDQDQAEEVTGGNTMTTSSGGPATSGWDLKANQKL
jgi:hypothetical protein